MTSVATLENIEHDPEQSSRNLKHLVDSYPLLFRSLVTAHRLPSGLYHWRSLRHHCWLRRRCEASWRTARCASAKLHLRVRFLGSYVHHEFPIDLVKLIYVCSSHLLRVDTADLLAPNNSIMERSRKKRFRRGAVMIRDELGLDAWIGQAEQGNDSTIPLQVGGSMTIKKAL
jgi:hypothetical protein